MSAAMTEAVGTNSCANSEKSDYRHPRLLRARRTRPRGRAAEQIDELASFHCQCFPCF